MVPLPLGKGGFFSLPEGWNKLPLMRELSPKVTEGEITKNPKGSLPGIPTNFNKCF